MADSKFSNMHCEHLTGAEYQGTVRYGSSVASGTLPDGTTVRAQYYPKGFLQHETYDLNTFTAKNGSTTGMSALNKGVDDMGHELMEKACKIKPPAP